MKQKPLFILIALSLGLSACGNLIPDISAIQSQLDLSDEQAASLQEVVDKFMTLSPEEQLDLAQSSGSVDFQSYLQELDALPATERNQRVRDFCYERPQILERVEREREKKAQQYSEDEKAFSEEIDSLFELSPEELQRELESPERQEKWNGYWQKLKTGHHYRYERETAAQEQAAIRQILQELEDLRRTREQSALRQQYERMKKIHQNNSEIYQRVRQPIRFQSYTKIVIVNRPGYPKHSPKPSAMPTPEPTATPTPEPTPTATPTPEPTPTATPTPEPTASPTPEPTPTATPTPEPNVCTPDAGNLVANAGFELPNVGEQFAFVDDLLCWTIVEPQNPLKAELDPNATWQPFAGQQSLDLNPDQPGEIAQNLATQVGQAYRLSFAMAGNVKSDFGVKKLEVFWGEHSLGQFEFDTTGRSEQDMGWVIKTTTIPAELTLSGQTQLRFKSLSSGSVGPVLDNIRVEVLSSD